jgi:hypothetical protein
MLPLITVPWPLISEDEILADGRDQQIAAAVKVITADYAAWQTQLQAQPPTVRALPDNPRYTDT